jgi:hypothetical protein
VLLAWKNWAIDHPSQDFEFWVGEGKNFEWQAVTDLKKFIVLKLRSEVVAKEGYMEMRLLSCIIKYRSRIE